MEMKELREQVRHTLQTFQLRGATLDSATAEVMTLVAGKILDDMEGEIAEIKEKLLRG